MSSQPINLMDLPEEVLDNIFDNLTRDSYDSDKDPVLLRTLLHLSTLHRTARRICSAKLYSEAQRIWPHRILAWGIVRNRLDTVKWVFAMSEATRERPPVANVSLDASPDYLIRFGTPAANTRVLSARVDNAFIRATIYTPLHLAARVGSPEICLFLLDRGARLWAKGRDRLTGCRAHGHDTAFPTPLHMAMCHGHEDLALLLLEKGASLQTDMGDKDRTVLTDAVYCRRTAFARKLVERGYFTRETISAHRNSLIERPAPLLLAAAAGYHDPSMVSFLISHGADPADQAQWFVPGAFCSALESKNPAPLPTSTTAGTREKQQQQRRPSPRARIPTPRSRVPGSLQHCALEALCDGFVKASVISNTKNEPLTVRSGTVFVPDAHFEEIKETARILLSAPHFPATLRRKGRFHHCMRGLLVSCLRSYRSDLDFGSIARMIVEAVQPPEFYSGGTDGAAGDKFEGPRDSLGEPVLAGFLRSAFEICDFRLFHAVAAYVARRGFVATIQHFLTQAPRMVLRLAWADFDRVHTLACSLHLWSSHFGFAYIPQISGIDRDAYGNVYRDPRENPHIRAPEPDKPSLSTELALEAIRYLRHDFGAWMEGTLPVYEDQDPDPDPEEEHQPLVDGQVYGNTGAGAPLPPVGGMSFWEALGEKKAEVEKSERGWFEGQSKPKGYSPADRFWREMSVEDIKAQTDNKPQFKSVFPDGEKQKFRRWLAEDRAGCRSAI